MSPLQAKITLPCSRCLSTMCFNFGKLSNCPCWSLIKKIVNSSPVSLPGSLLEQLKTNNEKRKSTNNDLFIKFQVESIRIDIKENDQLFIIFLLLDEIYIIHQILFYAIELSALPPNFDNYFLQIKIPDLCYHGFVRP